MSYPDPGASQIGQTWLWGVVDAGPTIGKVRRPFYNEITVVDENYTIQPFDFQILLKSLTAARTIYLPSVTTWMKREYGGVPILVKDLDGLSGTYNVTIQPNGSDTIDGLAQYVLAAPYANITIKPRANLSGWFVS